MLLTRFGEFVLPGDRRIWTNAIVDALATLGVSERNARQALARLRGQDVVRPMKHGRKARWHLTESGHELLATEAERIYNSDTEHPAWDGQYQTFIDGFGKVEPSSKTDAVGSTIAIVDNWRRFSFLDPELPVELLPEPWLGQSSARKSLISRNTSAVARRYIR